MTTEPIRPNAAEPTGLDHSSGPLKSDQGGEGSADAAVPDDLVTAAERAIQSVFEAPGGGITPENLVAHVEQTIGFGKTAWPLAVMRRFTDVLIAVAAGRRTSASLEARWLNLFGLCFRPGFGAAKDPWRIGEARKIYAAGLAFPSAIQNKAEWLVLWQRVAGGFSTGQQRELAQRVIGELGLSGKKTARLNPQLERESWRLLASLERLDAAARAGIGDELVRRVRRETGNASLLWAIGRLGARAPLYGPLSSVVPPQDASRWLDGLLSIKVITPEIAAAIVQIAARVGDPLRDLDREQLARARTGLHQSGIDGEALRPLEEVMAGSTFDANRVFGEPLPAGLRLDVAPDGGEVVADDPLADDLTGPGGAGSGVSAALMSLNASPIAPMATPAQAPTPADATFNCLEITSDHSKSVSV